MKSLLSSVLCTFVIYFSFIPFVNAEILWDYSPETTNGDGTKNWQNRSLEQNWAERITFSQDVYLTGMDIYSWNQTGMSIGDAVTVRVWTDSSGSPDQLIKEFSEPLSIIDLDGVGTISGINRKHVDFSTSVVLSANAQYWIGMSGNAPWDVALMSLSTNPPDDSQMARFDGVTFVGLTALGDMAFRLHGDFSPSVVRNPNNGHYYELIEDSGGIDWYEARDAAASARFKGLEGHLATVTSPQEDEFLATNFSQIFPYHVWLGATDEEVEGNWVWITGESWDYTNWDPGPGEPNGGTFENCLDYSNFSYNWNDERCSRKLNFYVVEYDGKMDVGIDIKPGNKRNVINPRSRGGIWVAVLSDSEFDPLQIKIRMVRFGPDKAKAIRHRVRDVNGDGLADLLLRFRIRKTGIECGDTRATLRGKTFFGQRVRGRDSIKTVGCKPKKCKKKHHHNHDSDDNKKHQGN